MNYKMTISYNGSNYKGWAIQPDQITIQQVVENALSSIYDTKIKINASGRTDAKVHALNQVVSFHEKLKKLEPCVIQQALLKKLPRDIKVLDIQKVNSDFHARYSALNKTYLYKINTKPNYDIFKNTTIFQYNKKIYLKKLKRISKMLIGQNDYLSFSTSEVSNTIRKINFIKIIRFKKEVWIYINANGFLRNMVRMIVGVLLAYNENKIDSNSIQNLLKNPKKGAAIYKAPGCGLYLKKVFYDNNKWKIKKRT